MATLKSKNRVFYPDDRPHFPELADPVFMDELAFEIEGITAQQAVLDTVDGVENPAPGRQLTEAEYLKLAGISKGGDGLGDEIPRLSAESPVAKFNPDQPRVPAGSAQGGEFVSAGAASAMSAGADATAHIEITEDSFYTNKVKVGNREIRGKIVGPYPLPEGIPAIPKDDAIYMEAGPFGERHVIDVKGRMVYELKPGPNINPEPAWGNWKLESSTHILTPQDAKPLSVKVEGSAAWATEHSLSWAKGSAFDGPISEGHRGLKNQLEEFGTIDKVNAAFLERQKMGIISLSPLKGYE